ncbi:MAG: hypothetical protein ACODAD_14245 [Planctomycetota bacterium]
MFGCVVDGFDGSYATGKVAGIFEFYDGYIGGTGTGTGTHANAPLEVERIPRLIIARSLIDVSNDAISANGSMALRLEGCYILGQGGYRFNNAMGHRDIGGQFYHIKDGSKHYIAYYDNIIDSGPNSSTNYANRAASNLFMMQGANTEAFDMVGNIFVQPPTGGGVRRISKPRKPVLLPGEVVGNYMYRAHFAENLFLFRANDFNYAGLGYPRALFTSIGGMDDIDAWVATSNLICSTYGGGHFNRTVRFLPEEIDADSPLPTLDVALANYPRATGNWLEGYQLDWSRTAYGGTSRQGYVSPRDVEVAPVLRRFSPDGQSGGPSLPHHGEYLDRFLELPEDFNRHLGYVDHQGQPLVPKQAGLRRFSKNWASFVLFDRVLGQVFH